MYYYSFNANRFLEKMLEIGKVKSTKDDNSLVTSLFYSIIVLFRIIIFMLLIALTNLWMFQFLLIAISKFFIKTSILVFKIVAGCLVGLGNIKKLTCWHPTLVVILII